MINHDNNTDHASTHDYFSKWLLRCHVSKFIASLYIVTILLHSGEEGGLGTRLSGVAVSQQRSYHSLSLTPVTAINRRQCDCKMIIVCFDAPNMISVLSLSAGAAQIGEVCVLNRRSSADLKLHRERCLLAS
ncbi:unnamed protein product [Sympodiomycopsis kandeliae]